MAPFRFWWRNAGWFINGKRWRVYRAGIRKQNRQSWPNSEVLRCASSAFSASRRWNAVKSLYRRDAENAEEAQRVKLGHHAYLGAPLWLSRIELRC